MCNGRHEQEHRHDLRTTMPPTIKMQHVTVDPTDQPTTTDSVHLLSGLTLMFQKKVERVHLKHVLRHNVKCTI